MRKKIALPLFLLILLLLVLVACSKREDEAPTPLPTVVPTAVIPTPEPPPTAQPESVPETAVSPINPTLIDWAPQVLYSSPAPGEEALLDGAITIRFDQPMNQASVESAFAIETEDGRDQVAGSFDWPREDTLVFTPTQLQRRQMYKVRIADTAVSANGIAFELPVELALETVGYLSVSQVIPADNTQGVQPDTAITVLFNRPVVPLVAAGQQDSLPQPLIIDPPVAGVGEWVSTSIYRFTPEETLDGATAYQVQVSPDLTDIIGAVLEREVSWRFTTEQPDVVSITPENGAESVPLDDEFVITFNMPMDRASVETAVSVRAQGEADVPDFEFGWSEGDRVLTLKPRDLLSLESSYQLSVAASARAANGSASLAQSAGSSFTTVRVPAVVDTVPANGRLADRWQRGFTIRFASPMDPATIEDRISISPEPTSSVRYYYNAFSYELSADFNLELNTRYLVTVPSSAADPYGNSIEDRYTFTFTTPGRQPIASFNLPGNIAQLSTAFETQVELIAVNISSANVDLYDVGLPVGLLTRPYDLREYRPATSPLRSWSGPLDLEQDVVDLLPFSLADGGTLPTGVYLLTVDAPETTEEVRYWQNQRQLLVVADTNIVVKEMFGEVHVWATDLRTGEPVAGRSLTLYDDQGVQVGTAVSDNNGFATFP
ncbi:MAG: Ig-like domain-containing protein, partial [Anaerolineales bacterium]|nr:Ig-like domain-containing protein [Anaerolineales bacterium]